MSNIRRLYHDDDHCVYVLLKTAIGYIAVDLIDGTVWAGCPTDVSCAVDGLTPFNYRLEVIKECVKERAAPKRDKAAKLEASAQIKGSTDDGIIRCRS